MVTRRTVLRTHLLRPDRRLNALVVYCLAVLATKYQIQVHAAVMMSTHEHLILTDPQGLLPRFLCELHRILALSVKALRKWEGAVWAPEKTSVVELCTPGAVIEKVAYVMANPVVAGLVARAAHWPGVTTQPEDLGHASWTAERPDYFFDAQNPDWPPTASLELSPLPGSAFTDEEARHAVAEELASMEAQAHVDMRAKGLSFPSLRKLASLSPFARARSLEPLRSRNPTFAVGRRARDAFLTCVLKVRIFRRQYRDAFERWRDGARDFLFPPGTWLMRTLHGAPCAEPGGSTAASSTITH